MYRGGRGTGRPKSAPPDLPSLLLDARICYLGMPVNNSLSLHLLVFWAMAKNAPISLALFLEFD